VQAPEHRRRPSGGARARPSKQPPHQGDRSGVKRQRSVDRAGSEWSAMRDLLWRCDEHRGPDAVAEHLYVADELAGRRPAPRRNRLSARLALRLRAASPRCGRDWSRSELMVARRPGHL